MAPQAVLEKAEDYFGALGLKMTSRAEDRMRWEGPRGFVAMYLYPGKESEVDIITSEWDMQVKKFLQRIG